MSSPAEYYQQQLDAGAIKADQRQAQAVAELERIFQQLIKRHRRRRRLLGGRLVALFFHKPVKGLYLWGSVGVGKTFLMDIFFHALPIKKLRMHFHAFMQMVQQELQNTQGVVNPLTTVAKKIAHRAEILCFDELLVNNITDAMLLGDLFDELFKLGVCLVTSSNTAPDDLYAEGLQRERFLPAIALLKQHCTIMAMTQQHDYRLDHLLSAGVYFTPTDATATQAMEQLFKNLNGGRTTSTNPLQLFARDIEVIKRSNTLVWFDFAVICGVPRSQQDYLALCQTYKTIFISNIPILQPQQHNLVTAFINLVDIFYDNGVRLVISAAAAVTQLYPQGLLHTEFKRTQSRLLEMQSADYFNAHSGDT